MSTILLRARETRLQGQFYSIRSRLQRVIGLLLLLGAPTIAWGAPSRYEGKYCEGTGDADFLRLIDESFAFFHPNPLVPNVAMLYQPDWNTFEEGAGWGAWWIQNSYGFSYAATPFLQEPWFTTLQNSWDLFWHMQGDGKHKGNVAGVEADLVGPDGCLGDTAAPNMIIFKQGDGNPKIHDWFYEATAAGVVMQSELLLAGRDHQAIDHYLPKMERACNFIEKARDPKNNLFLVGPACNLLAPSYGGVKQPDGSFGKGYLAGVSITYLAALDRMVELCKIAGDKAKVAEYEHRQRITRESLPQLLTPAGYFVKSIEPNGTKHGVVGQKHFGYLEGVCNADAVGLRVADDAVSRSIYRQIANYPAIRPFDFLLTNAPGLDDTFSNWGGTALPVPFEYGCWVNGGVWGTVEGRAILAYYRLGKFEDIRRSAVRAMKWAKDFRLDDHLTQRGENTDNLWYDKPPDKRESVAVAVDPFAVPAATIRGLFDYEYRADRIILRPCVPPSITEYVQKEPVRFGTKRLYISCRNGGSKVKSATVNGKPVRIDAADAVALLYNDLPDEAKVEIATEGGSPANSVAGAAAIGVAGAPAGVKPSPNPLPASLKRPQAVLTAFEPMLVQQPNVQYELAFVREALAAIEACRIRTTMDPGPGFFRPMTPKKRETIVKFYESAAVKMYNGLAKRMAGYEKSSQADQKQWAALFRSAEQSATAK